MQQTVKNEKFIPDFPHAHYHSYAVQNRKMVDINPILELRAADVLSRCEEMGAKTLVDVGSNLGGFLFYLEQLGHFSELLGIEGDKKFVAECVKAREALSSEVRFLNKTVMQVNEISQPKDIMLLQNVYHYIFDKEGSHEKIFRKFLEISNAIIWYNPMSSDDPVISKHANSNPNTDWTMYHHQEIFKAAIMAGYLHPLRDTTSRFNGMGPTREHWIFLKDKVTPLEKRFISASDVTGEVARVADHYSKIHQVRMSEQRSFKIFSDQYKEHAEIVLKLVDLCVLDSELCPGLEFVVNASGEVIGYSQPRGRLSTSLTPEEVTSFTNSANIQRLKLFSRMIRHDVFCHDLGLHNFVKLEAAPRPMLIDLENFVLNASMCPALSIYKKNPDENEHRSAKANLSLIFEDFEIRTDKRNSISLLRDALHKSRFLDGIDLTNILSH